jgi:hypothetical protein
LWCLGGGGSVVVLVFELSKVSTFAVTELVELRLVSCRCYIRGYASSCCGVTRVYQFIAPQMRLLIVGSYGTRNIV